MQGYRIYGQPPRKIVILHGGPGASGEMRPVAKQLQNIAGVLEPLQQAKTIEQQLTNLDNNIKKHTSAPVILIGWSFGALLAIFYAAIYQKTVKKMVLISTPPLEETYSKNIMKKRRIRMNQHQQKEMQTLMDLLNDPHTNCKDNILKKLGKLFTEIDNKNPEPSEYTDVECNFETHSALWNEMTTLRSRGTLLEHLKKIQCPISSIHGTYDPHPIDGFHSQMNHTLKEYELIKIDDCGHEPWLERYKKEEFYTVLQNIIQNTLH